MSCCRSFLVRCGAVLVTAACTSYQPLRHDESVSSVRPVEARFATPRTVRIVSAQGEAGEIGAVTAVRGRVVAMSGDSMTMRVDVPAGSIIAAGATDGEKTYGARTVSFARDADLRVSEDRVSVTHSLFLALLVTAAVAAIYVNFANSDLAEPR